MLSIITPTACISFVYNVNLINVSHSNSILNIDNSKP